MCRRAAPDRPGRGAPFAAALAAVLLCSPVHGALDLGAATVTALDNGLTVLVLEERSFPLVSVQMLYRAGARDEQTGRTGLAHFVEHMAFRGSQHFPDTGLVSAIYAAGGEWHGYTYLDQTTYFATAPAGELDLLLRIEADRLSRLDIAPADIPAERGAVLAEMHGYENDPSAVLHDATLFVALLAHPYRNNTIGWESDVRAITHDDVAQFYERHYQPGNAVLAIVGDVETGAVMARVRELFAAMPGRPASALPVTPEPPQRGLRRIRLQRPVDARRYQVVWPAPAATDPDYPAFLLLQELLSGSSGVNFLQNDWGTPARAGAPLAAVSGDVATWMMPTAQPYVFVVKGSIGPDGDERDVEAAIAGAVQELAAAPATDERLERARRRLRDELALDVQTTEDAAHQLAFWSGIDALDVLLALPARLDAVSAEDVRRVAAAGLAADRRTIGWSVPGELVDAVPGVAPAPVPAPAARARGSDRPAPPPRVARLSNGLPVLLQVSTLSPTVHLEVVLPGRFASGTGSVVADEPVAGVSAFASTVPAGSLDALAATAAAAIADATALPPPSAASQDPYQRIEEEFLALMRPAPTSATATPRVIALAGDFEAERALELLERHFGHHAPPRQAPGAAVAAASGDVDAHIALPLAQARVGYLVPAPGPRNPAADAWRALGYILSHDYEGRLGKEAISRRGLAYYIDSRYRSDGERAWFTLSAGVDPAKLADMRALLVAELERLRREPPTVAEVDEALAHRIGRAQSAHQSNRELAAHTAEQWLWFGELPSPDTLAERLALVDRDAVLGALDAFTAGAVVTVTVER